MNDAPVHPVLASLEILVNGAEHSLDVDTRTSLLDLLGSKGIGEIGIVGTAAAVANAVYDATGVRIRDLPITPMKLVGRV